MRSFVHLPDLAVDIDRVVGELDELARFSDSPSPSVTRIVYTSTDLKARAYIKSLCQDAGLSLREDSLGNLFARWEPEGRVARQLAVSPPTSEAADTRTPVATGSHIDAIPHSGRYDGTVGVIGGLEAIRCLMRTGFRPVRPIELVVFTSEEPTRFGVGCLGSRALSGVLSPDALRELRDAGGKDIEEIRRAAGISGSLDSVPLAPGCYRAFIELHIEQGPLLERSGVPIGIVTSIAAPAAMRVEILGQGGHAGTVLMHERHDALLAGAEIALAVERAAAASSEDTVATTGVFEIEPGAVNSIPHRAVLEIDIRDVDLARRDDALERIREAIDTAARRRGVTVRTELLYADPPAACAPEVIGAIAAACKVLKVPYRKMVSRAYHDSLFMSHLAPTGMIFIPCRGGVSHRPDEYASAEAIRRGIAVLAHALASLSAL